MKIIIEFRSQKIETNEQMIYDFIVWCMENGKHISPKAFGLWIIDMVEN